MNQYCQICRTYHEIRSAPCTGSVTTYAPIDSNAEIVTRDATIAELRATIDRLLGADAQWEYAKCWRDKAEKAEARIAELEKLRQFAQALFDEADWPNGGFIDEFGFQELAQKFGLLEEKQMTERCGEVCQCADIDEPPFICYRKTPLLLGTESAST